MTLRYLTREKKKSNAWKIFLILVIFILSIISIYFLFRLTNEKTKKDNNSLPEKKNWKLNVNYQLVQPTQKEAEYQGSELPISSVGTEHKKAAIKTNMLPRGSAILSVSGDLKKQGIKAIIHACPGSLEKKGKDFQPTIQGVIRSVQNSIILAERYNYKSVVFCLIGSNSLDSIIPPNQGTKKERQEKLAEIIIKSAAKQRKNLKRMFFVDFGNTAFYEAYFKIEAENKNDLRFVVISNGDITTSFHACETIVNSLNTEGEFINSRSFSGFIASKTGSEKNKIQKEIKEHITELNQRLKK